MDAEVKRHLDGLQAQVSTLAVDMKEVKSTQAAHGENIRSLTRETTLNSLVFSGGKEINVEAAKLFMHVKRNISDIPTYRKGESCCAVVVRLARECFNVIIPRSEVNEAYRRGKFAMSRCHFRMIHFPKLSLISFLKGPT